MMGFELNIVFFEVLSVTKHLLKVTTHVHIGRNWPHPVDVVELSAGTVELIDT